MSMSSDAFCIQLRKFAKYSTPPEADEDRSGDDDVLTESALRVARRRRLGELPRDEAEDDRTDEAAKHEPGNVLLALAADLVLGGEAFERDPRAEGDDLCDEDTGRQPRLEERPLLVEPSERRPPGDGSLRRFRRLFGGSDGGVFH
jgi:hypothetical protein